MADRIWQGFWTSYTTLCNASSAIKIHALAGILIFADHTCKHKHKMHPQSSCTAFLFFMHIYLHNQTAVQGVEMQKSPRHERQILGQFLHFAHPER